MSFCVTVLFSMILQNPISGKHLVLSYGLNCSQSIRFKFSLILNISRRNHSISQNFCMEIIIKEKKHLYHFWLGMTNCTSQPSRLQDYVIINISGRNQSISQNFCIVIIIKESQHLGLQILVWCGQLCLLFNQTAGFFDHQ